MATRTLTANTTLSALVADGLASGDTIQMGGCELAADCDGDAYALTLTGTGRLELRDGGRIHLAEGLPETIDVYVDPANPLPARNTSAGLTANAAAEIHDAQSSHHFTVQGRYDCPTGTLGPGWALATAWSADNLSLTLDRDIDVAPGDLLFTVSRTANGEHDFYPVASWDAATRTVTLAAACSNANARILGNCWCVMAGGVLIRRDFVVSHWDALSNAVCGGILNLHGGGAGCRFTGRLTRLVCNSTGRSADFCAFSSPRRGPCVAGLLMSAGRIANSGAADSPVTVAEAAVFSVQSNSEPASNVRIGGGYVAQAAPGYMQYANAHIAHAICRDAITWHPTAATASSRIELRECTLAGAETGDVDLLPYATVRRVSRRDFPADTDMGEAWFYLPASAAAEAWKTVWSARVEPGQTVRLSARVWIFEGSECRVGIHAAGLPPIIDNPTGPFGATLSEWKAALAQGGLLAEAGWSEAAGTRPLAWHNRTLAWTNAGTVGVDVQASVLVAGLSGALARVWPATGGAM